LILRQPSERRNNISHFDKGLVVTRIHAIPGLFVSMLISACAANPQLTSAPGRGVGEDAAKFTHVEGLIRDEFAKDDRGGLVVGIVENGELVWTRALGLADERAHVQVSTDSIFPIASATKMLTGIMLLQLVQRGTVHLSDPVERYVPEIRQVANPFPWAPPITLVQLATMTAGLQRGLTVREDLAASVRAAKTWEQKMSAVVPGLRIQYEPGTISRYSNASYAVLGLALSRAANRPFVEYVHTEILKPLGMRDSSFVVTADQSARLVRGYTISDPRAEGEAAPNSQTMLLLPAAGLLSTVKDLAKLMRFQMQGGAEDVLSDASLQSSYELLVPSDANLRYGDGIGFASVRDSDSRLTALGHGGAFPEGFVTSYEFDGATDTGVIFLANAYGGKANYKLLARQILAFFNSDSAGGSGHRPPEEH
jgi:CubicO group peptidase (beta-lactamase class C family)